MATHNFDIRTGVPRVFAGLRWVAAAFALAAASAVHGQGLPCRYEVDYVFGPACSANTFAEVEGKGISNEGDVCGYNFTSCAGSLEKSFVAWNAGTLMPVVLPNNPQSRALDVQSGAVFGHMATGGGYRGYRVLMGNATVIEPLPGGNWVEVSKSNTAGVIVGAWGSNLGGDLGFPRAYYWQNGVMTDLHLQLSPQRSFAYDINENGTITGYKGLSANPSNARAFIWQNGVVTDLGLMPGSYATEGRAINNHNEVAGIAYFTAANSAGFVRRGFFWRDGVFTDLGTLPGFTEVFPFGLTDDRLVVAAMTNGPAPTTTTGVIWKAGILREIKPILDPWPANTAAVYWVNGVSSFGQIVATCRITGAGIQSFAIVGARLRPIARRVGDVNCDTIVNIQDLLAVIQNWSNTGVDADINADFIVNVNDLLLVIVNWG